jgi:hypothetical protein
LLAYSVAFEKLIQDKVHPKRDYKETRLPDFLTLSSDFFANLVDVFNRHPES